MRDVDFTKLDLTDEYQRVALGLRPRTLKGVWWWFRYWSPFAHWGRLLFTVQCRDCRYVRWAWQRCPCRGGS
jgi:hypothetical protein